MSSLISTIEFQQPGILTAADSPIPLNPPSDFFLCRLITKHQTNAKRYYYQLLDTKRQSPNAEHKMHLKTNKQTNKQTNKNKNKQTNKQTKKQKQKNKKTKTNK
jgi:hypothetical protein